MKRILPLILLLTAALPSRGQLLDSQAYSGVGETDVAVFGYVEFWKINDTTGRIDLTVWNLSVFEALDDSPTGFENGVMVGFGFDVASDYTWNNSFNEMNPAQALAWLATGTDDIDFAPEEPFSGDGVAMDIGGEAVSPAPSNGLEGGYWTKFSFWFTTASDIATTFNSDYFFDDADGEDLYFRFQSVSSNGSGTADSDKVYIAWDDGGGGFDNPVPEPSTYGLIGAMALLALVIVRARKS